MNKPCHMAAEIEPPLSDSPRFGGHNGNPRLFLEAGKWVFSGDCRIGLHKFRLVFKHPPELTDDFFVDYEIEDDRVARTGPWNYSPRLARMATPLIRCVFNGVHVHDLWLEIPSAVELERRELRGYGAVLVEREGPQRIEFSCRRPQEISLVDFEIATDDRYAPEICPEGSLPLKKAKLFVDDDDRARLLERAELSSTWRKIERLLANRGKPERVPSRNVDGVERMAPFDWIVLHSFRAWLRGDRRNYLRAKPEVERLLRQERWCSMACGPEDTYKSAYGCDNDRPQGESIFALCLFLRWCEGFLDEKLKRRVERKILRHGEIMAQVSMFNLTELAGSCVDSHHLGMAFGLRMAGITLAHKYRRCRWHARWGRMIYEKTLRHLPADGTYDRAWSYDRCQTYHLWHAWLWRDWTGEDLLARSPFFPESLKYRNMVAMNESFDALDFDSHRRGGVAWIFDFMAAKYGDGALARIADRRRDEDITGYMKPYSSRWLWEFLLEKEAEPVKRSKPTTREADPTAAFFPDKGALFWRDGRKRPCRHLFVSAAPAALPGAACDWGERWLPRINYKTIVGEGRVVLFDGETGILDLTQAGYLLRTENHSAIDATTIAQLDQGRAMTGRKNALFDTGLRSWNADGNEVTCLLDLARYYPEELNAKTLTREIRCDRERFVALDVAESSEARNWRVHWISSLALKLESDDTVVGVCRQSGRKYRFSFASSKPFKVTVDRPEIVASYVPGIDQDKMNRVTVTVKRPESRFHLTTEIKSESA